jgi:hypothetical protein
MLSVPIMVLWRSKELVTIWPNDDLSRNNFVYKRVANPTMHNRSGLASRA